MKKIVYLLFLLLMVQVNYSAKADLYTDSIRSAIQQWIPEDKLDYLEDLCWTSVGKDHYFDCLHLYKEEALTTKDSIHIGRVYTLLGRAFFNIDRDSTNFYYKLAEPILLKTHSYEDYFRMRSYEISALVREGKNEEVVEQIDRLKAEAARFNYPEGIEVADQALGNFYFLNGMPQEGEKIYADVLERLIDRKAPLYQRVSQLTSLFNMVSTVESRLKYLNMTEVLLNECKEQGIEYDERNNPLYNTEFSMHHSYAVTYAYEEKFDIAIEHIKKAEAIMEEHKVYSRRIELVDLYMNYYTYKKEYAKALPYLEELEQWLRDKNANSMLADVLSDKARSLTLINRKDEAIATYQELVALTDSLSRSNYQEKLADMRTKYEVEKLELEKQQIEIEARQTQITLMLLVGGCLFLLLAVVGLVYLVRASQRSKRAFKLAKEKAEETDRMKSIFLANMNHEIRTPLNAIVGFSQVLVDEEDRDARQEFSEIIQSNNELLQQLIADILDISKVESDSLTFVRTDQDMPSLMKDVYNTLRLRVPDSVEFILDQPTPFTFKCDRNRLIQVITNLLTNAIKHTTKGHIRFGYTLSRNTIKFYVEDTGEGIKEGQLKSIFGRFRQLENGKKGVGLGLAISKGIVTKMGGKIWATSKPGKGSTFFVEIPLKQD